MSVTGKPLTRVQRVVLGSAFVPMLATGAAGGFGTYTNITATFGSGTAVGAVAAGEGATAVLAIVLLGLTLLGQSAPLAIRAGLWALPAAASAMSVMAATTVGEMVIYALTPLGMTASAEGAAFLARRIVVYRDGRDAEAERRAAEVVQALAYHRARAANHPDEKVRRKSDLKSWQLAQKVGAGDLALGERLLTVQRAQLTTGADAALAAMFGAAPAASTGPELSPGLGERAGAVTVELEVDRSTRPVDLMNGDELYQTTANRLRSDLQESTPAAPAEVAELPAIESADLVPVELPQSAPALAVAAVQHAPRRATGRVPESARTPRPTRTPDELLSEARSATADWPDAELTAEAIRKAVRTSSANGRTLRDTLKAERADQATAVAAVAG